jgi:hypothetical protein
MNAQQVNGSGETSEFSSRNTGLESGLPECCVELQSCLPLSFEETYTFNPQDIILGLSDARRRWWHLPSTPQAAYQPRRPDSCVTCLVDFRIYHKKMLVHAVAQLVEALRCKSEGRGVDSRWCHWNFSLTYSIRPHYGPGLIQPLT